ncbi:MAG: GWxTD domain-containing protein [Ignavibacteriales bacterium]|nr:GWxTD domain-containing protein [Ignavibacteriales bacterium]
MKKLVCGAVIIFAMATGLTGCAASSENIVECYFSAKYRLRALPLFDCYPVAVKGKTSGRIDAYVLVPYNRIRFQKNGDDYRGSYSVTFILRDNDGQIVLNRETSRSLAAASYERTTSAGYDAFMESFDLPPGVYRLDVHLVDDGSGLHSTVQKHVTIPVFQQTSLGAGDFLLLEHAVADARGVVLRPQFPSQLRSDGDSLGLFQEIYDLLPGDSLRLSFSYSVNRSFSESDRMIYRPLFWSSGAMPEKENDSSYYQKDSLFVVERIGTVRMLQFFCPPRRGYTTFRRHIVLQRSGTKQEVEQQRSWLVAEPVPTGRSSQPMNPEILAYIVTDDERDSLSLGVTPADKLLRVSKFWEAHGGPQRRREYEDRVREANELFTAYTEGWRTPMGAALIVCGTPDYVECQGGLSEVWYYGAGNQTAAVSFRSDYHADDEEPFYRIVPFSTNDFFWRSCVDRWRRR